MSLTNTGENRLLELFRGAGDYYVGLFTAPPSDTDSGTEISAGGYARQAVTFGEATNGTISNSAAIEFPTATADWGTASAFGVFDAESGGTLLWYGEITTPKPLYAGDIYRVNAGGFILSLD